MSPLFFADSRSFPDCRNEESAFCRWARIPGKGQNLLPTAIGCKADWCRIDGIPRRRRDTSRALLGDHSPESNPPELRMTGKDSAADIFHPRDQMRLRTRFYQYPKPAGISLLRPRTASSPTERLSLNLNGRSKMESTFRSGLSLRLQSPYQLHRCRHPPWTTSCTRHHLFWHMAGTG